MSQWFESWFDSPYYAILYQHRNQEEAAQQLSALISRLNIAPRSRILDLCCGTGRHANWLCEQGFEVTGLDLSARNIAKAKTIACTNVQFRQLDMRKLDYQQYFDLVLNLFTSFGYFETYSDNLIVLTGVAAALRENGRFVLDYLNPVKVINEINPYQQQIINNCEFHIKRYIEPKHITPTDTIQQVVKEIEITDHNHHTKHYYQEKVTLFQPQHLITLCQDAGFAHITFYGSYDAKPYDPPTSDRMLLVATKS
jgi:SAM-dependent methyltransferase